MSEIKKFQKRIRLDDSFKEKFKNVKNANDVVMIAKENGYDLTNCSKKEEEQLTEDMLENVAGGKAAKIVGKEASASTVTTGNGSSTIHEESIYMWWKVGV